MRSRLFLLGLLLLFHPPVYCWGFYAHRKINYYAVFLLPPAMMVFYKPHIEYLADHAVDPDKRRYVIPEEGSRHYIDMDHYGQTPFPALPRNWEDAISKYGKDSLLANGIVPWWIGTMLERLTKSFEARDGGKILKLSAEIGHYIADAHVPLHTNSNHNGQNSGQTGIHGFWESRVPELLAEKEYDFFIGPAQYLAQPQVFIWKRILESAASADTVLQYEKELTRQFAPDQKFSFEERNGQVIKQYSSTFTQAYDRNLKGMVERRMRQSIWAIASFWYTAWVNAGQPELGSLQHPVFSPEEKRDEEDMQSAWLKGQGKGRICDE